MGLKKVLAKGAAWLGQKAASAYVAGAEVRDAVAVCRKLAGKGCKATICPWDLVGTPVEEVGVSYRQALEAIAENDLEISLSIKTPSIGYDFGIFKDLVSYAAEKNIRVHLDGMAAETVDRTFRLIEQVLPDFKNLGYTLPSRWKRSFVDFERTKEWGLPVRLVKGQWICPRQDEVSPEQGLLKLVDLFCGRGDLVAIGSHDHNLSQGCLHQLVASGTPCELEQLYGLPFYTANYAKSNRVPIRVYVPYDCGYLPYALSAVARRPIILWWLSRDLCRSVVGRDSRAR